MFEEYHFSENAKIVSKKVPGEKSLELLAEQEKVESKNRSYPRGIPIAFESAKGATLKDVDGNIFKIIFFSLTFVLFHENLSNLLRGLNLF